MLMTLFSVSVVHDILSKLNEDLRRIELWFIENKMKVNPSKSKALILCSKAMKFKWKKELSEVRIKIDNKEIEVADDVKYLGVTLDSELNLKCHSANVLKGISRKVGFFRRICLCLDIESKTKLYQSIIAPCIDYCSSVLFLLNKNDIEALQKQQNKAVRSILQVNRFTPIKQMYNALSWLNIRDRILLNTLTFIFRLHKGLAPEYLINRLSTSSITHTYYTRGTKKSKTIVKQTSSKYGDNTLFNKGMKIYNRIPQPIRELSCTKGFRRACCRLIKEKKSLIPLPYESQGFWDM